MNRYEVVYTEFGGQAKAKVEASFFSIERDSVVFTAKEGVFPNERHVTVAYYNNVVYVRKL